MAQVTCILLQQVCSSRVIANDIITYIIAGNGYFSNMMMDGTNLGDFDGYNNSYVDQQSQTMQV